MTGIENIKEDLESIKSFVKVLHNHPKVHCIVNDVAINLTANALLAIGAQPSMTNNLFEVTAFTESADSLSINIGMLTEERRHVIRTAAKCAHRNNIPWVLDTTFIDRSPLRCEFCEELLVYKPTVLRGNQMETLALCDHLNQTKVELCRIHDTILVTTGEIDWVDSKQQSCELKKLGHPWMSQVAGMGCTLSALIAAMLTACDDAFSAALKTLFLYGVIGDRAAKQATGPGTFVISFLDGLST